MEVIPDVTTHCSSYPNLVLTIGSFDGVHLGHRKILNTVIARARARNGTAALMSLWPHPKAFFSPEKAVPLLSDPQQKESLLRELGLDVYFILPFTHDVARMEPGDFLDEVIVARCGASQVVVGHDFSFGARASGDFHFLATEGARHGLTVEMIPPVVLDGERVSSTHIRHHVMQGDFERARRLLGRPYAIAGVVSAGRGIGRELGFPTANIIPSMELLPARGIYAARVPLDGTVVIGAVNIGIAPTLPHERPVVEVHLLDFEGELAGQRIEVQLFHRLRDEKKFDGIAALKEGIQNDIVEIRQYFDRHPE